MGRDHRMKQFNEAWALLRLAMLILAPPGGGLSATAAGDVPTECDECWLTVTSWRGSFTLTANESDALGPCSVEGESAAQGSFEIVGEASTVTGSARGDQTVACPCSPLPGEYTIRTTGSGAIDSEWQVALDLFPSTCSYRFGVGGGIRAVATTTGCDGAVLTENPSVIEAGGAMPAPKPLPPFGETLSGTVTYSLPPPRKGGAITLTWNIEPVIDRVPPKFGSLPPGGPLGCNPTNIPNDFVILEQVSATAASGKLVIESKHVDVTNGCHVTRSFSLSAKDTCLQTEARALVVYWWTQDTNAPVITSVPPGANLGCNPADPPDDARIKNQVRALDDCLDELEILVAHTDSLKGCTLTRTFSIAVQDSCENVSPAETVAYTWTVDTTPPTFTQLPPDIYLGLNPPAIPDDDAIRGMVQASGGCGVPAIKVTHADGRVGLSFKRTFTISATNPCGNEATATVVYTWESATDGAPSLCIARVGGEFVICWSTNATGFILETRRNLAPTEPWLTSPGIPVMLDGLFVVKQVPATPGSFYRLAK